MYGSLLKRHGTSHAAFPPSMTVSSCLNAQQPMAASQVEVWDVNVFSPTRYSVSTNGRFKREKQACGHPAARRENLKARLTWSGNSAHGLIADRRAWKQVLLESLVNEWITGLAVYHYFAWACLCMNMVKMNTSFFKYIFLNQLELQFTANFIFVMQHIFEDDD